MNQNEIFLPTEAGTGYLAGTDSTEQIQAVPEALSTEQNDQETQTREQADQAFRWDKITTWPPDVAVFFIVAGTALCLLQLRRTQFELWFGEAGYRYGNILIIVISLFILCLFLYRGCHGEF